MTTTGTANRYGRPIDGFSLHRALPPLSTAEWAAENAMLQVEQDAAELPVPQSDGNFHRQNFVAKYGNYAVRQPPAAPSWKGNIEHATKYWDHSYVPIHHLHQLESLVKCVTCAFMTLLPLLGIAAYNCRWARSGDATQRAAQHARQRILRQNAVEDLTFAAMYILCGMVCAAKHAVLTVCIDPITYAKRCIYPVKRLLIVVDPQLDFMPRHADQVLIDGEWVHHEYAGRLPVAGGHEINGTQVTGEGVGRLKGGINELAERFQGAVVATKDEHPIKRKPHGASGAMMGVKQGTLGTLNGVDNVIGWIFHCIVGTRGNQFSWRFDQSRVQWVVKKGTEYTSESFGGFANADGQKTLLEKYAKAIGVTHVDVVGLAYDYCVGTTALQAADVPGIESVRVLKPVTRSVVTALASPDLQILQQEVHDILILGERSRILRQARQSPTDADYDHFMGQANALLTQAEYDTLVRLRDAPRTDVQITAAYGRQVTAAEGQRNRFVAEARHLCNDVQDSEQAMTAKLRAKGVTIVDDIAPLLDETTTDAAYIRR